MRIIAGEFKGRRIDAPRSMSVRPTSDRVKVTIFDVLSNRIDLEGARVLDLFAGGGTLGLEAISRGARHATFVDASEVSLRIIARNLKQLGIESRAKLIRGDAVMVPKRLGEEFELVFIDPPYGLEDIASLPLGIASAGILASDGWAVMKFPSQVRLLLPEKAPHAARRAGEHVEEPFAAGAHLMKDASRQAARFECAVIKRFGETSVAFFHHQAAE